MPKYVFECQDCRLKFERVLKMGDYDTHPCPGCKEEAPLVVTSFAFGFAEGKGAPANSGVHKHDYPTADQAVGSDAERRWGVIHEREKVKAAARQQGGTRALIRRTAQNYIDYEPMTATGLETRKRLYKRVSEATQKTEGGGQ